MEDTEMSYIKEIGKGLSASTYRVLSTPISAFQIPGLITKMEEWIAGRGAARCITFTNVHVVMEALHDKEFNAGIQCGSE
jgi:UDP-N-acetyl-D-mannosaminuronic acid transferase (WecB/TagA/CpsF family)